MSTNFEKMMQTLLQAIAVENTQAGAHKAELCSIVISEDAPTIKMGKIQLSILRFHAKPAKSIDSSSIDKIIEQSGLNEESRDQISYASSLLSSASAPYKNHDHIIEKIANILRDEKKMDADKIDLISKILL
jgi:hypothetical protein